MKFVHSYKDIMSVCVSFYVSIYLLVSFCLLFLPAHSSNVFRILLLITTILLGLITCCRNWKFYLDKSLFLMLLFCFFYVINQLFNLRSPLSVLYPLSNCFLGYMVYNNKINLKALYAVFLIISSILLYFMINLYDPNLIFDGGSRNLISVVLLYTSLLIYSQELKLKRNFHLLPAIFTFIFSVWAIGRSGIICSLILCIVIFSSMYKKMSIIYKTLLLSLFILPLIYLLIINIDNMDLFIRFQERGLSYDEDERSVMLHLYLSHVNWITLLFGYDYFSDNQFAIWEFNVHNSFISFHSLWGGGALLMIVLLLRHLWLLRNTKLTLTLLIGLFLLRAFFDAIAFNGMYDFVLLSMILYSYSDRKHESWQN